MMSSVLFFDSSSSDATRESESSIHDDISCESSTSTLRPLVYTNEEKSQPAKRPRNQEKHTMDTGILKDEQESSQLSLLKAQIDIQKKLYDALSKSLEENKENSKSMRYNTRKMYEALEGIKMGSVELIRTLQAQNIEAARHNKVMENLAKQELKINQRLLELKLKKTNLPKTP